MAVCGCTSGMLFWKKPCDRIALDDCASCGIGICADHARRPRPGRFYCPDCASAQENADTDTDTDSDSGSDSSASNAFSDRSGVSGVERIAAAVASGSWFKGDDSGGSESGSDSSSDSGSDSSSGDSGSSDSGGGDSGGSSSD